jgi:hypothetical protein
VLPSILKDGIAWPLIAALTSEYKTLPSTEPAESGAESKLTPPFATVSPHPNIASIIIKQTKILICFIKTAPFFVRAC